MFVKQRTFFNTIIMWFWLVVVREKSIHLGEGVVRYFSQFRRENRRGTNRVATKHNTLGGGYYLIFRYLKPIFQPPPPSVLTSLLLHQVLAKRRDYGESTKTGNNSSSTVQNFVFGCAKARDQTNEDSST